MSDTPLRAVRVPDSLWSAAREAADAAGTSVSAVVRDALRAFVESVTR